MDKNIYIQMNDISKSFGSVVANNNINLKIYKGEVHALLGENGAGKSTLMNMLSGIYSPDSGSIYIHGRQTPITSPKQAISLGIGMIHQHFKLVDILSAKENIILGQKGSLIIDGNKLATDIKMLSKELGMEINPDKKIYNMSVSEKQTVEILKVLYQGADILILDEPTAVLTPQETQKLFNMVRKLQEQGCAIIIITHKLNEVMEISNKVTVLRKGETVKTLITHETNIKELTDLMVGRSVDLHIERTKVTVSDEIIQVKNVTAYDNEKVKVLDNIDFIIRGGEILGVAGVANSGQKELCEAISGLYTIHSGDIVFKGESIKGHTPRDIIKRGISMSFIPEDRLGMGLIAAMDIVDNVILKDYMNQKGFFINRKPSEEKAKRIVKRLDVKTPGLHYPIRQLSGGNIQKVLLGREIDLNPQLLITAYPVRGLDIGASHTIYNLLNEQKKIGVAILFVGEDLDVLIELCDRIMVLCDGKVTGIVDARQITKEQLGLMMAGELIEDVRRSDYV